MDNPLLCFVHIPKTAGTSVRAALQQMVGPEKVYWIGVTEPNDAWDKEPSSHFTDFLVVGGHAPASAFRRIDRPKIFATAVREPVQRATSLFNYITEGPNEKHPLRATLRSIGFERALRTNPHFRLQVENLQCRWIGGIARYVEAVSVLSKEQWIVSRHDRIDSLLDAIAQQFGWPRPLLATLNAATDPYYDRVCTPRVERLLRKLNREDSRLMGLFR